MDFVVMVVGGRPGVDGGGGLWSFDARELGHRRAVRSSTSRCLGHSWFLSSIWGWRSGL